jgi:hypothetical protein
LVLASQPILKNGGVVSVPHLKAVSRFIENYFRILG